MATDPSDRPLDRLMAATEANVPGTAMAGTTQYMLTNYPPPGSMEATAHLTGQVLCGQCHALNAATSKFCRNCGSPLAKISLCPSCKAPVGAEDKFCGQCGKALEPSPRKS